MVELFLLKQFTAFSHSLLSQKAPFRCLTGFYMRMNFCSVKIVKLFRSKKLHEPENSRKLFKFCCDYSEAVTRMCHVRKLLFKILQNSQEDIAMVSFLVKLQAAFNFTKKERFRSCFSENFVIFCRTCGLQNPSERLLSIILIIFITEIFF